MFNNKGLELFLELLGNLSAKDFSYHFHGKKYTLLKYENTTVGLCLTPEEVPLLIKHIKQALMLNEAFRVIYD